MWTFSALRIDVTVSLLHCVVFVDVDDIIQLCLRVTVIMSLTMIMT